MRVAVFDVLCDAVKKQTNKKPNKIPIYFYIKKEWSENNGVLNYSVPEQLLSTGLSPEGKLDCQRLVWSGALKFVLKGKKKSMDATSDWLRNRKVVSW